MNKSPDEYTDQELLDGIRMGSNWAYQLAYKKFYRMVEEYVKRNNGSSDDARDLFQEVLIILMRVIKKPGFSLNKGTKLSTYIYGIARNLWLDRLRKGKKNPTKSIDTQDPSISIISEEDGVIEKVEYEKKHVLMSKVFDQIGEDCKKLLQGYYYKKIQLKVLATEMGYTDDFIRQKKKRCMNAFRKKVVNHSDFNKLEIIN